MSGFIERDFTPEELEQFEAGYGVLNKFIKDKIHEFRHTMFQDIDNYRLDISVDKGDQNEVPGDNL